MGWASRTAGNVAKAGAKKAGKAVAKKARGGCPGSDDGKHSYKAKTIKKDINGKKVNNRVTYCHNPGCGRVH